MKRIIALTLFIAFLFSFCACSNDATDNSSTNDFVSVELNSNEDSFFVSSFNPTESEFSVEVESSVEDISSDTYSETIDDEFSEGTQISEAETCFDVTDEDTEVDTSEGTENSTEDTSSNTYEDDTSKESDNDTESSASDNTNVSVKPEESTPSEESSEPEEHFHNYIEVGTLDATCTEDGAVYYECECGKQKTKTIRALDHNPDSWKYVIYPSENQEGLKEQYCYRCGVLLVSEVLPKVSKYEVIALESNTALVEERILYYINQYRVSEGACEMSMLQNKARSFARRRAEQLVTNYGHDEMDARAAATEFEYGIYVPERPETIYDWETDTIIETGKISPAYYSPYGGEAIGNFARTSATTVDMLARNIARGFYDSKAHWDYVGSNSNPYIAIGIKLTSSRCYVCLITSDVTTYD